MPRSLRPAHALAALMLLPAALLVGCPFHEETFHRACTTDTAAADCDDGNPCTDDVCSAGDGGAGTPGPDAGVAGVCENPFSKKEFACKTAKIPAGVCDGAGTCVECLTYADCAAHLMDPICDEKLHKCVSCADGIKDGKETDVDCGGPDCGACLTKPCDPVHGCGDMTFCSTNDMVCCSAACNGKCQACTMANTGKPDGTCAPVPFGMDPFGQCRMTGSNLEGGCGSALNKCACEDGAVNGNETDVDCGGGTCPPCGGGKKCMSSTDCAVEVPGEMPVCTSSGICCESICNQACETCDTMGHCASVAPGSSDPNMFCHANQACGAGTSGCVGTAGAACNPGFNGADCLSGTCPIATHTCAKGGSGKPCNTGNDCTSNTCQGNFCN